MRKIILTVFILLCFNPAVQAAPFYTIAQINNQTLTQGTIRTEGYVAKLYQCPPCPMNAVCKLCGPPYAVIAQSAKTIGSLDEMAGTDLLVNTSFKDGLRLGQKYRLVLAVQPPGSTGKNNFVVVDFELSQDREKKSKRHGRR